MAAINSPISAGWSEGNLFGEALINRRGVYGPVKTNRRLW
jgi:hypothetical protein